MPPFASPKKDEERNADVNCEFASGAGSSCSITLSARWSRTMELFWPLPVHRQQIQPSMKLPRTFSCVPSLPIYRADKAVNADQSVCSQSIGAFVLNS